MNESENSSQSPSERVQTLAVGAHRIADRFPEQERSFAHRLKIIATSLLEDVALFEVAKTRDALGTNRLIHQILGRMETLKALLTFVKNRELAAPATADIVLWQLNQLAAYFQQEDARIEQHIAEHHPQGSLTFEQLTEAPQPEAVPQSQPETKFDEIEHRQFVNEEPHAYTAQPVVNPAAVRFDPFIRFQSPNDVESLAYQQPTPVVASTDAFALGNSRQKRILDFFAMRRRAQLKDVLSLFPDISEKTVRNDLVMLCKVGQLRRVGLAPRSHYVLTA